MNQSSLKKSPPWYSGARFYAGSLIRRMPVLLNLEVTMRCNAKCRFCSYWHDAPPAELDSYKELLRYFKPVVWSISGGEPLIRKDLAKLIAEARSYCHYVGMVSNGMLLNEDRAEELSQAGLNILCISLDFVGDEHDQARGVPGLYKKVTTIVPELISKGYNVGFNTVIMESNLDHILPLAHKAKEWGANISFSCYCGLKKDDNSEMVRDHKVEQVAEVVRELKSLKKQGYKIKNSSYYLDNIPVYFRDTHIPDCKAGTKWVQVAPDGYVRPCSELSRMCHFSEYKRKNVPEIKCSKCWYACRGEAQANHLKWERLVELARS